MRGPEPWLASTPPGPEEKIPAAHAVALLNPPDEIAEAMLEIGGDVRHSLVDTLASWRQTADILAGKWDPALIEVIVEHYDRRTGGKP